MQYKISCKTKPGMFAQYECEVEINAYDEEEAIDKAWRKLKNGAFFDHSRSMWNIVAVQND